MPFRSISIRAKLALSAAALTAFAIVAVIALTTSLMTRDSARESEAHAGALMTGYAATIAQEVGSVIDTVRTGVAGIEGAIADDPANRDALASIVTTILRTRPDLVGMTLALEPDALGPDGAHLGSPYADAAGRFVPYFFYAPDGSIGIEQLDMRPEAGTDSWYDRPLREDRSLITPPYLYPVNGAEVLMTTVSGVVRDGTRPVGVLTGDVSLDRLSARIEELRPFGDGRVRLVSSGGCGSRMRTARCWASRCRLRTRR